MTTVGHEDLSTRSFHPGINRTPSQSPVLILTLLTHPRLATIGARAVLRLTRGGSVSLSRTAPDFILPGQQLGEPLGDPAISRTPLRFQAAPDGEIHLIRGENQTSIKVDGAEIGEGYRLNADELSQGVCLSLSERVAIVVQWRATPPAYGVGRDLGMIGYGEGLASIRSEIVKVAPLDVPVLIRGETGTGKELVARALHRCGNRFNKPFVDVNLGALPHSLAAAELFGVRRGAFTGAGENKLGYFRAANGGVLFLDEIGETPLEVQAMLLRLLETGQVAPVGTHEFYPVDVRLISATDADLEARIEAGSFKEPLLHRLATYEIFLPPLRQRREDIGPLFLHFAKETLASLQQSRLPEGDDPYAPPWLSTQLAVNLARFHWPGNIRQLRNLVRKLIIGNQGQTSLQATPQVERILGSQPADGAPRSGPQPPALKTRRKPSRITEEELKQALSRADWEPKAAASLLNLARSSIYDLIRKFPDIRTAADLSTADITACFQRHGGDAGAMYRELQVSKPALLRRIKAMGLAP